MTRPQDTTPANPAQVTDAIRGIVDDALNSAIPEPWEVAEHATQRILAAIDAGGQAVAEPVAWQHRLWYADSGRWSEWRDGHRDELLGNKQEERPLYTNPAPTVAVKPLEWEERSGAHYVDTAFGEACVDVDGDGFYVIESGRKHSDFASVEAAQAFVQKHHDIWVKDWLDPSAVAHPVQPGWRDMESAMNSELERFAIQDLRTWGCKCKKPLLGWRPEWGPRCRLCNTENPNRQWKAEAMEVLRTVAEDGELFGHPDKYQIAARRLVKKEDGR